MRFLVLHSEIHACPGPDRGWIRQAYSAFRNQHSAIERATFFMDDSKAFSKSSIRYYDCLTPALAFFKNFFWRTSLIRFARNYLGLSRRCVHRSSTYATPCRVKRQSNIFLRCSGLRSQISKACRPVFAPNAIFSAPAEKLIFDSCRRSNAPFPSGLVCPKKFRETMSLLCFNATSASRLSHLSSGHPTLPRFALTNRRNS